MESTKKLTYDFSQSFRKAKENHSKDFLKYSLWGFVQQKSYDEKYFLSKYGEIYITTDL